MKGIRSLLGAGVVETRKGVENGVVSVDNWSGSDDNEGKGVDNLCGVEDIGRSVVVVVNLCGIEVVVVEGVGVVDNLYGSDDVAGGNLHKHTFFVG